MTFRHTLYKLSTVLIKEGDPVRLILKTMDYVLCSHGIPIYPGLLRVDLPLAQVGTIIGSNMLLGKSPFDIFRTP